MVNNYFLRTLVLALILVQSYATATILQEEPTREITGPNGENLWDYLFVQKPLVQPAPKPVSAPSWDDEDLSLEDVLLDEEITPDNAPIPEPLSTMSPDMTNREKMESTTDIESMLSEDTQWATP